LLDGKFWLPWRTTVVKGRRSVVSEYYKSLAVGWQSLSRSDGPAENAFPARATPSSLRLSAHMPYRPWGRLGLIASQPHAFLASSRHRFGQKHSSSPHIVPAFRPSPRKLRRPFPEARYLLLSSTGNPPRRDHEVCGKPRHRNAFPSMACGPGPSWRLDPPPGIALEERGFFSTLKGGVDSGAAGILDECWGGWGIDEGG